MTTASQEAPRGAAEPEEAGSDDGEASVNEPESKASNSSNKKGAGNDKELVERVQAGDSAAFRELFEKYHRRAYAVAFGVVKNKQDALDIVQDGFIKVHRHIGKFQGSSSFYTWLYRIIMNLSIDHVRRRKGKDLDYDDRVGRDSVDVAGDGTLLPTILDANPRKTVLRKELSEAIQKALDELPEYHRAVIMLREVEGMSYEDMSKILKVPKGTIMSRLFHARRKMQSTLGEYLHGDLTIEE
ncbi:MAG: sigma-70 family RNA polymerase sigma factor [Myxococcota bacterium]